MSPDNNERQILPREMHLQKIKEVKGRLLEMEAVPLGPWKSMRKIEERLKEEKKESK